MTQVLTVSCKLNPTSEQAAKIDATLKAFADACTWVNLSAPTGLTNPAAMQKAVYHEARVLFGLSANLTVRAVARVCANRKTAKVKGHLVKSFAATSIDYDARIFSLNEKRWMVSVTLLGGREHIPLAIGNYQRHLLARQQPTSATLVKRKDGSYYIQIQVKSEPGEPSEPEGCLGVDLGRTDIAHTSTGESFDGQQLKETRDRFARTRARLQHRAAKGTRSTRRRAREHQKRLGSRERRFQTNINHRISHRLVQQAKSLNWSIALEDLTGIRQRTNTGPQSKTERRRSNSWAFYQLRQFVAYKAIRAGVSVVLVKPAYTSQTCHCCHRIGERQGKSFRCGGCGWHGDADFNGSVNISQLGRLVNSPRGPWMACRLEGF
ncbi:RNA-guided endonuclease InsQ/TnpB family protein [Gloeobacter kilaueensis]|uniref:Transposase, IS605 OrfB family n=1 Tax=Gloeobacter kilaueensis (strain ATCC BAA-2537 / CCAP 1431/1 / ULC 316 / JS1) TaxID=1183438 RepID=U5QJV8_GLOK1|nr:RNA-guided endonuclease TnpB family protein [Gloeobacter kilaueensis]AGY57879.1 transposase, IS605 OrfB family [Gloeobacter kilaueensis JS1]